MSQKLIYKILEELGGTASPAQIKKLARDKYPERSLADYIYAQLNKLKKWGIVEKNEDGTWSIIEKYPDNEL